MVKDGEDWHGLQTTILKSLAKLFKQFNCDWAPLKCIILKVKKKKRKGKKRYVAQQRV